jgi:hypothetical protein
MSRKGTRCLDTIEAVGLRAISGTIKKSDQTTISIRTMACICEEKRNNDHNDQHVAI